MKKFRIPLRAVLYREGEYWVAHCLELDLLGDGTTPEDALLLLSQAIGTQLESCLKNNAMNCFFSPAELRFFQMFAEGKDVAGGAVEVALPEDINVLIEPIQAREYVSTDCGLELVEA